MDGDPTAWPEEIALRGSVPLNWHGSTPLKEMVQGTGMPSAPTKALATGKRVYATASMATKAKHALVSHVLTIAQAMALASS
jgi:hypothetical protein